MRWATTTINKYRMDAAGKTASQRVTGRNHRRPIAKFGKKIIRMPNGKRDQGMRAESNWHEGVFLGLRNVSTEAIIGTSDGISYARTIQRRSLDERWSMDVVVGMKCSVDEHLTGDETVHGGGGHSLPQAVTET